MKLFLFVAILVMVACDLGSFTAPNISAGGILPIWMFAHQGRLVRPKPGSYGVYLYPEIAQDAEMSQHMDRTLQAANALTSASGIVFRRSNHKNAPISFRLDPNNPLVTSNAGWSELHFTNYECSSNYISIDTKEHFLMDIPLHELGHFLFGPGHSVTPEDTMHPSIRDHRRMSFSENEHMLWRISQQFPPGTLP